MSVMYRGRLIEDDTPRYDGWTFALGAKRSKSRVHCSTCDHPESKHGDGWEYGARWCFEKIVSPWTLRALMGPTIQCGCTIFSGKPRRSKSDAQLDAEAA